MPVNTTPDGATTTISDAISYPGGKGQIYRHIINLTPPHNTYIELFAGGGAVLRHKRPATVGNIAIDVDASALNTLRFSINISGDVDHRYQFLHTDAFDYLASSVFTSDTFMYVDPPYLLESRKQHRQMYRGELSAEAHSTLLAMLIDLPCRVAISGYWSQLYADTLAGWHHQSWRVRTRGGSWAKEFLWMNYPRPVALHDYSYLGSDYRERERIKRKTTRWANKWAGLPILERQAILAALQETGL